jgi:hypothetical protein
MNEVRAIKPPHLGLQLSNGDLPEANLAIQVAPSRPGTELNEVQFVARIVQAYEHSAAKCRIPKRLKMPIRRSRPPRESHA